MLSFRAVESERDAYKLLFSADAHREFTKLPSNAEANRGHGVRSISKIGEISKILQIFGGLVLGCIKTRFCKRICV